MSLHLPTRHQRLSLDLPTRQVSSLHLPKRQVLSRTSFINKSIPVQNHTPSVVRRNLRYCTDLGVLTFVTGIDLDTFERVPRVKSCGPRRAHLSRDGPVCPEAGLSIPRRAYLYRGGPICHEAGLSVPRRACLSRGGPIRPEAGLSVRRRAHMDHSHWVASCTEEKLPPPVD